MTKVEFDGFRSRTIRNYAAEQVRAGNWTAAEAETRAATQTDELLPQGADTPGALTLVAETPDGELFGHVWVGLERYPGSGGGAWIYDIEIVPEQRGKGYGRALLSITEQEVMRHGVHTIGLNVFGTNSVARSLYKSSGYETTSLHMHKQLTDD